MKIAFFGSSILSAYWNGAATYYRGMVRALNRMGHSITFYEPDAFDRQAHLDLDSPDWVNVVVYPNVSSAALQQVESAGDADWVIKASGVGVFDDLLEMAVLEMRRSSQIVSFWDVDAPATLDRVQSQPDEPFGKLIPRFDLVLTYGGGKPVIDAYKKCGAKECYPIYNGFDPDTHHPVRSDQNFLADLSFLGNRLPDREARVEEFFFKPAVALPDKRFLLAGNGWGDKPKPENVNYLGHLFSSAHNSFNCSPLAVLNVNRQSMAKYGFSPATRLFEAAGAGACMISDRWVGIEDFFEPGKEILIVNDGEEVAERVRTLTTEKARTIGQAAYRRAQHQHTYAHRAKTLEIILKSTFGK
ncbi:MAG: glycosyltransferase [Verrucomicrobia bacterium]|nr:glycosyltransferase [Verrucomicrobiota bacterium]